MASKATGGPKGRPKTTQKQKIKTGSLNVTREKEKGEGLKIVPLEEYPMAPDDLGFEGKNHWDVVVRELTKLRVLSSVDLFTLRALCIEWQCYLNHRQQQMDENIGSYYVIKGKNGDTIQPHPIHYNGTNHLREYTRLCREFGLTPASRAQIGINANETSTSKAASLLKKAV